MKLINISSWGLRRSDVWIQWEGGDGLFIFIFHLKFSTTRGALSLDSSFIFDSMPTRSGIHIMCGISGARSQVEFHFEWASASCSRTVPSIPIPSNPVPSRLTRHSVRASAIASPRLFFLNASHLGTVVASIRTYARPLKHTHTTHTTRARPRLLNHVE